VSRVVHELAHLFWIGLGRKRMNESPDFVLKNGIWLKKGHEVSGDQLVDSPTES
jgi:hypothetical protein